MARFPEPPDHAALRALPRHADDVRTVPAGTRLVRIFNTGGRHSQPWNTFRRAGPLAHARFDPHPLPADPDHRHGDPTDPADAAGAAAPGVLYCSLSARTSVAEVYQTSSVVDRRTRAPHLLVLRPTRTLRLLDLTGLWPTRAGASQTISAGPTGRSQAWARAIRAVHPELDGLWYRSVMDAGEPVVCLWDPPAATALPAEPSLLVPLSHPGLDLPLGRICEQLNYTMLG